MNRPQCPPTPPAPLARLALALALALALRIAAPAQVLVATNATWSYHKGTREASSPPEAWRSPEFADASWLVGRAPFYYDTGSSYSGHTALPDMRNGYTTLYLRHSFVVPDAAALGTLNLRYLCDDGFALWINGVLVTQVNKSDGVFTYNALADANAVEPISWLGRTLPNPGAYLRNGTNLLAVQAFNVSRTSSDFLIDLELVARPRDAAPPSLTRVDPPPGTIGSLHAITVTFSEPVTGIAFTDLLINDRPASGLTGSADTYTFTLEQPAYGPVRVRWDPGARITDFADPPNPFPTDGEWSYQLVDTTAPVLTQVSPAPGTTVRQLPRLEIVFSEPVVGLDAADLTVNGDPATTLTGSGSGPYAFELPAASPGLVTVAFAPDHEIADEAQPANPFAGGSWSYTLDPDAPAPTIVITEFLTATSGDSGLRDEDDELQDWIELQNRSESPVNLAGWSLTDDPDRPGQWTFPDTPLAPGAFVVVFASGKDRRPSTPGRPLHTNFRLGADGEYLALFNAELPRLKIVEFAPVYPPQRPDLSYGVDPEDRLRYFPTPTPGASNRVSTLVGAVPAVEFNVRRGLFLEPFELHLSCPLAGADIRYTTDGSEPTPARGRAYEGPLRIASTTLLRAAAFLPNHLPSISATHTFIFPHQVARQPAQPPGVPAEWIDTQGRSWTADYGMDPEIVEAPAYRDHVVASLLALPSLSLVTRPEDMFDNATGIYPKSQARGPSWERPASAEFIDAATGDTFQIDCGVQMQGNSVRDPVKTGKHAFRLVFKGDYGPSKLRVRFFPDSPVEAFDTLTLRADFNNSWMHWNGAQRPRGQRIRDAWMKDTHRAMGGLSSHSRFVHLYVNGLYWGVYDPTERPDASFAAAYLGGSKEDYDVVNEGQLVDGTMTAYNTMRGISNLADNTQYERMQQFLDVPAYIDYLLLHFYTGHEDWFTDKNWYALRRRAPGEGFRYQCWDGELMLNSPTQNIITRTDQPSGLHPKLLENAQYRLDFADRVQRHFFDDGTLTPASVIQRYERWADLIAPAMIAESARWGDYRRDVHPYSSGPYVLYTPHEHFATERQRLLTAYFPGRTTTVLNQLKSAGLYPSQAVAPAFQPSQRRLAPGTPLTLSAPAGTIYFTTDGTDPRVRYSGDLAPTARTYSGPIPLASTTRIMARTRTATEWSALSEALFEVGQLGMPLAITELHYHPRDGDPYEFIEIRNVGATALDASGVSLEGVQFVFPPSSILAPGQTVVLASDLSPSSFALRHPGVPVFGYFDGNLNNAGERLALLDRDGKVIVSVDYLDRNGWPAAADGTGPSLELLDPFGDPDAPHSWRASTHPEGTPGVPTVLPPTPALRLNELMAANRGAVTHDATTPDWLELHNAGTTDADLGGWSLSDRGVPGQYVLPPGTLLPADGHLVLWCDTATSAPGLHTGFALDQSGETITLFNPQGDTIDSLTFGLQVPDLTVGRIGGNAAWTLCQPTPGAPNLAQPLASPDRWRLNEWLADSEPGATDWIELHHADPDLPASLQGLHLATATALFQLRSLSFVGPNGHALLVADERPGPDHLDFKLPAAGGHLALFDPAGTLLDAIDYGPQTQGVSQGRLPDGADTLTFFPTSPTPGGPNHLPDPTGPILNELLAWNRSAPTPTPTAASAWLELYHPGDTDADLGGMSLSLDRTQPRQWVFPDGLVLPPKSFLVVSLDDRQPPSTQSGDEWNTGFTPSPRAGAVFLFDASGQLADAVEFGFQVPDVSIGRTPAGWRLLARPTPGTANPPGMPLASPSHLRVNEWLAAPTTGPDWIELFNLADQPASLDGLQLSDDPSLGGTGKHAFGPLSFIAPRGHVRVDATRRPSRAGEEANFQLEASGEAIVLRDATGHILDAVYFGLQAPGTSLGRLPDGADAPWTPFPSPTPGLDNATIANRPPVLAAPANPAVTAGATLTLTLTATDPDVPPQTLTYRLALGPAGAQLDARAGVLTWRPALSLAGTSHAFEIAVADDGLPSQETQVRFEVPVLPPAPPRLEWTAAAPPSVLHFRVHGDPGPEYLLQQSADLRIWTTLRSTNPVVLPFEWIVPVETETPARFLRLQLGP